MFPLIILLAMANLQFHEMSCDNYDLCLSIAFDDGADDFLLMNKYQGIDTIFVGTLMTEGTSATVVYSNSEEIEVKKVSLESCEIGINYYIFISI